jgi:hypothetical protein
VTEGNLLIGAIVIVLLGAIFSGRQVVETCPVESGPGRTGCLSFAFVLGLGAFIGGMLLAAVQRGHI